MGKSSSVFPVFLPVLEGMKRFEALFARHFFHYSLFFISFFKPDIDGS
jgi:hypothetical protein